MATTVTLNGINYTIPANREPRGTWGTSLSAYLIAVSSTTLQKSGGNFTLTADVNFGASYGITSLYFKSGSANIASVGVIRLANNEGLAFRNAANSADIAVKINASDRLEVGGVVVPTISSTDTLTNKTLTSPAITTPTGIVKGDVGLGNVDNTSDANKPVSTAGQAALDLKANIASPTFTGTVAGITSAMVGLGNVDNTSDATKNAAAVVLTNKDIDGGTASNTSRITLPKASTATLSGLTRKAGTIMYDTTTSQVNYDDGSVLTALGAASQATATVLGTVKGGTVPGDTSGSAIAAGYIGEIISNTAAPGAFTAATDMASVTMTTGVWLCSGAILGNGAGSAVEMTSYWKVKGTQDSTSAKSFMQNTSASGQRVSTTMCTILVVVASGDADKTVKIRVSNSVSQAVEAYVQAVRIA